VGEEAFVFLSEGERGKAKRMRVSWVFFFFFFFFFWGGGGGE
jgi:hypothetical protein